MNIFNSINSWYSAYYIMGFSVDQDFLRSLWVSIVLASLVMLVGGVPTQINLDGSVLPVCGGKLTETTSETIQYDNDTVITVKINHCTNIPKFVTCVNSALQQSTTWADVDQALFGEILDLDGLLAAYRDMCSRLDYFDANKACLDETGSDGLLFRCVTSNFPSVYGIAKSSHDSNICSTFREHTNCTTRPPTSNNCDEDFLVYLDQMNRRVLKSDCRSLMYGDGINASSRTAQNVILTIITLLLTLAFH